MLKDKIAKSIQRASGVKKVHLEIPEIKSRGDYATNVAMVLAKQKKKNPRELAEEIKEKLEKDNVLAKIVAKIEVAGPGFINFWLKEEFLVNQLQNINDEYGKSEATKGKKVMFEYGQPNTHKLPHIGHLFSYVFGESMTRIMEANGWKVYRVNYQGDVGPHVAKCLWAIEKTKPNIPDSLEEKVELLQKMYQEGSRTYGENSKAKEEIDKINREIYMADPKIKKLWEETRGWSVNYYKAFEKRLGVKYDRYYFESEVGEKGKEIVKKNTPKVFKKSKGAYIFEGSKYGLHDRVFVTGNDTPTYEAKDMYLEELKMKEWPADLLIISTASEQNEYFKVVFKALETLHPNFAGKLKHIGFGMINLKSGKMSSRTGNIIGGIELVNKVIKKVSKLNKDKKIAEVVGLGAIKYSFLKTNPLQNVSFDIDESLSLEGNSGSYIQYTYARTQSVLKKSGNKKVKKNSSVKLNSQELAVLRTLPKFPEVVAIAAESYSPNLICNYLYDLAQKFNTFYNAHKIIGSDNEILRLKITAATGQVLVNGLNLLGIQAPEKM